MIDTVAVNRYAEALFGASSKNNQVDKVEEDLILFNKALNSTDLKVFLGNPKYSNQKKEKVISSIGKKLSSDLSIKFLNLLLRKSRMDLFEAISEAFSQLKRRANKVVFCEVFLADEPSKGFLDRIKVQLTRITKAEINLHIKIDPSMVGGVIIKIDNQMIDASIKSKLFELEHRFLQANLN